MQAIIYSPTKNAMQSGKGNLNKWVLEFEHDGSKEIDFLSGWTSTRDTQQQVILNFISQEEAENFAKKHKMDYEIIELKRNKKIIKAYADNFKPKFW